MPAATARTCYSHSCLLKVLPTSLLDAQMDVAYCFPLTSLSGSPLPKHLLPSSKGRPIAIKSNASRNRCQGSADKKSPAAVECCGGNLTISNPCGKLLSVFHQLCYYAILRDFCRQDARRPDCGIQAVKVFVVIAANPWATAFLLPHLHRDPDGWKMAGQTGCLAVLDSCY